jgi:hypothetical protein
MFRTDTASTNSKSLEHLFLDDWSMVLVVDDRVDVWNSGTQRHQLLQVMPFVYPGFSSKEQNEIEQASAPIPTTESSFDTAAIPEFKEAADGAANAGSVVDTVKLDGQLMRCLEIITDVHREFYDLREQKRPETTGAILSQMKRRILEGCVLVFSGVIPKGALPNSCETHPIWQQAQDLGAKVCYELTSRTTHLITTSSHTTKARSAISAGGICIVHVDWLFNCIWNLKRIPEDYYLLEPLAAGSRNSILDSVTDAPSDQNDLVLGKRARSSDSEDDDDWLNDIEAELDL